EGVPPEQAAKEKPPGDPVVLRVGAENQRKEAQAADLVQKAMLKLDRGDWDGAIADLTQAIQLEPENHAAWSGRAMSHNMAGKYSEAEADAKKAIELDSRDARAWTTLAWAQFKQGKFAEALASAEKAIALDPKSALAHAVAAYAREALGDKAGALLSIQSAARLDGRFFDQYRRGKSGGPILDGSVDIDRLFLERRFRSNYERGRSASLLPWLIGLAAMLASIACFLLFRKGRGIGGRDLLAKSLDYLKKDFGKR
ncbi:MAG: tetratricopeptide repeat protein, partial [Elusimicrobiota bacterium]